jgi:hypothetical protein
MNRINKFNLEPGPYADQDGRMLVVTDLVTHLVTVKFQFGPDEMQDPLVVTRALDESKQLEHNRIAYPLSVFKSKYKKV